MKILTLFIFLFLLLVACQSATASPISATIDSAFTLVPEQTARVDDTGLSVKLVGISGDNRCPSDVECVESGFVSLIITLQKDTLEPAEFVLETFTNHDGLAAEGPFEGIQDRVEYEGYLVQVKSVLPYPAQSFNEIKDSEYQVSFLVTAK